jgi:hypothetical protein
VKILKAILLVAIIGITGSAALADGGAPPDPTVIVNRKGDPLCNQDGSTPPNVDYVCFSTNSQQDPLIIPTGTSENFVLASGSLTSLYVEVSPADPTELYSCAPGDIFAVCGSVPTTLSGAVEFGFFDGTLNAGDELTASAPEPAGLVLLMGGLIPLVAFRKRIASNLSL